MNILFSIEADIYFSHLLILIYYLCKMSPRPSVWMPGHQKNKLYCVTSYQIVIFCRYHFPYDNQNMNCSGKKRSWFPSWQICRKGCNAVSKLKCTVIRRCGDKCITCLWPIKLLLFIRIRGSWLQWILHRREKKCCDVTCREWPLSWCKITYNTMTPCKYGGTLIS